MNDKRGDFWIPLYACMFKTVERFNQFARLIWFLKVRHQVGKSCIHIHIINPLIMRYLHQVNVDASCELMLKLEQVFLVSLAIGE